MIACSRLALPFLVLVATALPAVADGPGPDAGIEAREAESPGEPAGLPSRRLRPRPPRRVTGDAGYVGSDYGLGKPAYYGLGSRPDWGRSSAD